MDQKPAVFSGHWIVDQNGVGDRMSPSGQSMKLVKINSLIQSQFPSQDAVPGAGNNLGSDEMTAGLGMLISNWLRVLSLTKLP